MPAKLDGQERNWLIVRAAKESAERAGAALRADARARRQARAERSRLERSRSPGTECAPSRRWRARALASSTAAATSWMRARSNLLARMPRAVRTSECVLDGVICSFDEGVAYVVFDVLELEGESLLERPWSERREHLAGLLDDHIGEVRLSRAYDDGAALRTAARAQGLGVVAKRRRLALSPGSRERRLAAADALARRLRTRFGDPSSLVRGMRVSLGWFDLVRVSATVERRGIRAPGLAQVCTRLLWFAWLALLPLALVVLRGAEHPRRPRRLGDRLQRQLPQPAHEILRGASPYHPDELVRVKAAVAAGHESHRLRPRRVRGVSGARAAPGRAVHRRCPTPSRPGCGSAASSPRADSHCVSPACATAGCTRRRCSRPPVIGSLYYGAVDLVLMLGLAACWRWRDHAGRAGLALGASSRSSSWRCRSSSGCVATRRWRAAATSLAVAGTLAAAAWAAIGFDGLTGYPHLLSLLTDIESDRGYSARGLRARRSEPVRASAAWAPYAVGACLLAGVWVTARRGPRRGRGGVPARRARGARALAHRLAALARPAARAAGRSAPALRAAVGAPRRAVARTGHPRDRASGAAGGLRGVRGRPLRRALMAHRREGSGRRSPTTITLA